MAEKIVQTAGRNQLGEFAPMFAHLNDDVLFGEVWNEEAIDVKTKCIITVVSLMASGRLSRLPGEGGTKRAQEDAYAKFKYDATAAQDNVIIERVAELAKKRGVTMTEVSLAWLLTKVTSPVVGATKFHHIEGAVGAVDLELTPEEIMYLEEPYVPHPLAGVMAQNKPAAAKEKHVWSTGDQKI